MGVFYVRGQVCRINITRFVGISSFSCSRPSKKETTDKPQVLEVFLTCGASPPAVFGDRLGAKGELDTRRVTDDDIETTDVVAFSGCLGANFIFTESVRGCTRVASL
jgi:hypothetical protein